MLCCVQRDVTELIIQRGNSKTFQFLEITACGPGAVIVLRTRSKASSVNAAKALQREFTSAVTFSQASRRKEKSLAIFIRDLYFSTLMCGGVPKSPIGVDRVACDGRGCGVRGLMPPGTMSHHHHQNSLVSMHGGTHQRSTEEDLQRLSMALSTLETSCWYHGAINFAEAKRKLRHCDIGTFLVRDSSDPNYLYSLSVKTPRGTTSVRIEYEYGKFTLDSEEALRRLAPSFDCVVKLLHHYMPRVNSAGSVSKQEQKRSIESGSNKNNNAGQFVWLEPSGRRDIAAQIIKPLRSQVPSLEHLCRLSLNRNVEPRHQAELNLPGQLKGYLKQYPFEQ